MASEGVAFLGDLQERDRIPRKLSVGTKDENLRHCSICINRIPTPARALMAHDEASLDVATEV
jgi:hypothetical protein